MPKKAMIVGAMIDSNHHVAPSCAPVAWSIAAGRAQARMISVVRMAIERTLRLTRPASGALSRAVEVANPLTDTGTLPSIRAAIREPHE